MPSLQERPFKPSTIGTIDEAVYRHIDEKFNLFLTTAAGREKVPVIWQTAERTFQIKNNLESRDSSGKLILPIISVTRDSIEKDPSFKGKVQAHIFENNNDQGGAILVSRKILSKEVTKRHVAKNLENGITDKFRPRVSGRVVYEEEYMPVPVYVKVMYTINLRTEYIQQMNELMSPFLAKTGQIWSFTIVHEGHRYETFIEQTITDNKNTSNLGQDERKFEAQVKLRVLGYLTTEGENRSRPHYAKRETITTIAINESVVSEIPIVPLNPNDTSNNNNSGAGEYNGDEALQALISQLRDEIEELRARLNSRDNPPDIPQGGDSLDLSYPTGIGRMFTRHGDGDDTTTDDVSVSVVPPDDEVIE